MAYEQKDNSGALFKNERKESENHPDRTGTALIDGVEYWVSGWLKKSKDGEPYMSLAFKPKDDARGRQHRNGSTAEERLDGKRAGTRPDKDIPW